MKLFDGEMLRASGINPSQLPTILQNSQHITYDQMAPWAIGSKQLKALAVTDAKINDLTANKITTGTLQASTSITIGGTFNTGTAGAANVKIDPTGVRGYDSTNTQRFALLTTGAGWLGNATDFSWTAAGAVTIKDAAIDTLSVSKLTAGNLTATGTITTGKLQTAASPAPRIELTSTLLAGYSDATTKQFYLDASTGVAYAGAGAVILDSSGLTTKGQYIFVKDSGGTLRGSLNGGTVFTVQSAASTDLFLSATAAANLNSGTTITLAANGGANVIYLTGSSISCNNKNIVLVADPTSAQDVATKNYVDTTAAGSYTSQANPARSLDTVYQNTGSKSILVTISVALEVQDAVGTVSGSSWVTVYSDSSNPPTTQIGALDNYVVSGTTGDFITYYAITFAVLPGNYYKVTKGKAGDGADAALQTWTEWS